MKEEKNKKTNREEGIMFGHKRYGNKGVFNLNSASAKL